MGVNIIFFNCHPSCQFLQSSRIWGLSNVSRKQVSSPHKINAKGPMLPVPTAGLLIYNFSPNWHFPRARQCDSHGYRTSGWKGPTGDHLVSATYSFRLLYFSLYGRVWGLNWFNPNFFVFCCFLFCFYILLEALQALWSVGKIKWNWVNCGQMVHHLQTGLSEEKGSPGKDGGRGASLGDVLSHICHEHPHRSRDPISKTFKTNSTSWQ